MRSRTVTRECQNETADWGSLCPDCGQRLPEDKGPLRSDKAMKNHDEQRSHQASLGPDRFIWRLHRRPKAKAA